MKSTKPTATATCVLAAAAALLGAAATPRASVEQGSAALAKQLTALMTERKLEAIAAPDPAIPDRFVAAMAFPDVQLLVVAARHASPAYLQDQIAKSEYRNVYGALQEGPILESKIFFQDLGGDGLHADRAESVDIMYEKGVTQTLFDGNRSQPKLSGDAYQKKFTEAETQYSKLLEILIAAALAR